MRGRGYDENVFDGGWSNKYMYYVYIDHKILKNKIKESLTFPFTINLRRFEHITKYMYNFIYMNLKKLTRQQKEELYKKKVIELQTRWKNPIPNEWGDFREDSDEMLEKGIKDTMGQLRFEKFQSGMGKTIVTIVYIFVSLGVIGLLIFGIRQIF